MGQEFKEQLQDSIKDKNKLKFFLYELLGTAVLTWGYNISGGNGGSLLFVLSLICWEVSCAHFNNSISLATLIFNRQDFKENLTPFAILTIV